jgi:hypothetical protein
MLGEGEKPSPPGPLSQCWERGRSPSPPSPSPNAGRGGEALTPRPPLPMLGEGEKGRRRCGSQPHVLGQPVRSRAIQGSAAASCAYEAIMVFRRCGSQPHILDRPENLANRRSAAVRPSPPGPLSQCWERGKKGAVGAAPFFSSVRLSAARPRQTARSRAIQGSAAASCAYEAIMVFRRCGSQPHVLDSP